MTDRPVTIRGSGADRTVIDGMRRGSVFTFKDDLLLADLTVTHGLAIRAGITSSWDSMAPSLTIEDCDVVDNESWDDIAVPCSGLGGGVFGSGDTRIVRSTIAGNRTSGCGGGVKGGFSGRLEIIDSTIVENFAALGGGVLVHGTRDFAIDGSTIARNEAYLGSALAIMDYSGRVEISNSTVTANRGPGFWDDAAIWFWCGTDDATIRSSTIVGNEPAGLAVWNDRCSVTFSDLILAHNGSSQCAGASMGGELVSAGHNLATDDSCTLSMPGDLEGVDPVLMPLGEYGGPTPTHALHPDSPAIDAGGGACLPHDQRGVPRPIDGNRDTVWLCDIGAVEFVPYCDEPDRPCDDGKVEIPGPLGGPIHLPPGTE